MKSCKITLAGLNGISTSAFWFLTQSRIFSTSEERTLNSSQFLTADSNNTLIEYGRASKNVKINHSENTYWVYCHSKMVIYRIKIDLIRFWLLKKDLVLDHLRTKQNLKVLKKRVSSFLSYWQKLMRLLIYALFFIKY